MKKLALLVFVFAVGIGLAFVASAGRNSSGTYSLASGNPVVSGTSISSTWANNTLNDISGELTNSLDRLGRGGMSAPLQLSNGTVAAPALTFTSQPTTGLYRAGVSDVRLSLAGADADQFIVGATRMPSGLAATPGIAFLAETGSGFYRNAAGDIRMSVGGTLAHQWVAGSSRVTDGALSAAGLGFIAESNSGLSRLSPADLAIAVTGTKVLEMTPTLNTSPVSVKLSGSNPASSTAFVSTLTPKNIVKMWANVTSGASPAINDGFGISAIGCAASLLQLTFAQAMTNTTYAVTATFDAPPALAREVVYVTTKATGSFKLWVSRGDTGGQQDMCVTAYAINVVVIGAN